MVIVVFLLDDLDFIGLSVVFFKFEYVVMNEILFYNIRY